MSFTLWPFSFETVCSIVGEIHNGYSKVIYTVQHRRIIAKMKPPPPTKPSVLQATVVGTPIFQKSAASVLDVGQETHTSQKQIRGSNYWESWKSYRRYESEEKRIIRDTITALQERVGELESRVLLLSNARFDVDSISKKKLMIAYTGTLHYSLFTCLECSQFNHFFLFRFLILGVSIECFKIICDVCSNFSRRMNLLARKAKRSKLEPQKYIQFFYCHDFYSNLPPRKS